MHFIRHPICLYHSSCSCHVHLPNSWIPGQPASELEGKIPSFSVQFLGGASSLVVCSLSQTFSPDQHWLMADAAFNFKIVNSVWCCSRLSACCITCWAARASTINLKQGCCVLSCPARGFLAYWYRWVGWVGWLAIDCFNCLSNEVRGMGGWLVC